VRILTRLQEGEILGSRDSQGFQVQAPPRFSTALGLLIAACLTALVAPSLARGGNAQIVDPDPGGPHLTFTAGSGEANHLLLLLGSGGYRVVDLGAAITAGTGCVAVNSSEVFCAFTLDFDETPTMDIVLGDLDDFASISPKFASEATIDGQDGADELEISAGCEAEDVCNLLLLGGPGVDILRAVGAFALLDGGAGGDTMEGLGAQVDYRARVTPVSVVGNGAADDGEAGEGDNVSANVDVVLGTSAGDSFTDVSAVGRGGNDTFISTGAGGVFCDGGSGDDVLIGGAGEDFCFGGTGEDALNGGGGFDDLEGGGGADTIRGGPGRDFLFGGRGADTIRGGPGRDFLFGERGDDLLVGGDGRERRISGGRGDDTLRARDGLRERVSGGRGSDRARVDSIDTVRSIEGFF
jgi:Ca2+-binding RTX toxin-like protein